MTNDLSTRMPQSACSQRNAAKAVPLHDVRRQLRGLFGALRSGFVVETVLVSAMLGLMIALPIAWH